MFHDQITRSEKALIWSICLFLWCKPSQDGPFQAINEVTEWELGDVHIVEPAPARQAPSVTFSGRSGPCLPLSCHSSVGILPGLHVFPYSVIFFCVPISCHWTVVLSTFLPSMQYTLGNCFLIEGRYPSSGPVPFVGHILSIILEGEYKSFT